MHHLNCWRAGTESICSTVFDVLVLRSVCQMKKNIHDYMFIKGIPSQSLIRTILSETVL